jgi:hypothetical protein
MKKFLEVTESSIGGYDIKNKNGFSILSSYYLPTGQEVFFEFDDTKLPIDNKIVNERNLNIEDLIKLKEAGFETQDLITLKNGGLI